MKFVWKHLLVHQDRARAPALAACAAQAQEKFWEMYDAIFSSAYPGELSPEKMRELAGMLKLDAARFARDVEGDKCRADLTGDQELMGSLGVRGTPTFFINGRLLVGAQPIEAFRALVDEELAKARAAEQRGVKRADYYEQEVVAKGKQGL